MMIAFVVMALAAFYALAHSFVAFDIGDCGLVFTSANNWIASPLTAVLFNLAVCLLIIVLMAYINKAFTIPRSITSIYATLFAVMQTATPDLTGAFAPGNVLCILISACMVLMFSSYAEPMAQRRVFLVFFLLSAAVSFQYAYIVYIPVFAVACAQMRLVSPRTVIAAIIGVITPWWLLFGFGIIAPADFHWPALASIFTAGIARHSGFIIVAAALSAILAVAGYSLSFLKLMTYNARTRACNGLIILVCLATVLAMCVDFGNILTYLPMLNFCSAFMLSHMFVIRNRPRAWISAATIVIVYYILYIVSIWRVIA